MKRTLFLSLAAILVLASRTNAAPDQVDVSWTLPDSPRDQENVLNCHIFAAIPLLESALFRQYGLRIQLSEADLFTEAIVLQKQHYFKNARNAVLQFQESGKKPENRISIHEADQIIYDLWYALNNGVATKSKANYKKFIKKYRKFATKEERALNILISEITEDRSSALNRFDDWVDGRTENQSRFSHETILLGRRFHPIIRLYEDREIIHQAFAGFKIDWVDFEDWDNPLIQPFRGKVLDPGTLCKLKNQGVRPKDGEDEKTWIMKRLLASRPVAVAVDEGTHAVVITGFHTSKNGSLLFEYRDSLGAKKLDIPEDQLCAISDAASVTTPSDPPNGNGQPAPAPQKLQKLAAK